MKSRILNSARFHLASEWGATGFDHCGDADYVNRNGCTRQQHGGNPAGTHKLPSHRWISGSCG